jgi:hypothetical protein
MIKHDLSFDAMSAAALRILQRYRDPPSGRAGTSWGTNSKRSADFKVSVRAAPEVTGSCASVKDASRRSIERALLQSKQVIRMISKISGAVVCALLSSLAACGGSTPPAEEPQAAVAEERAEKAEDATKDNTDRAENAADKAEDSAAASDKSADKAEKSAEDAKK